MITKFSCLDIGKASTHELRVPSFHGLPVNHQMWCKLGPLCNGIQCVDVFIGAWSIQKE